MIDRHRYTKIHFLESINSKTIGWWLLIRYPYVHFAGNRHGAYELKQKKNQQSNQQNRTKYYQSDIIHRSFKLALGVCSIEKIIANRVDIQKQLENKNSMKQAGRGYLRNSCFQEPWTSQKRPFWQNYVHFKCVLVAVQCIILK